MTGKKSDKYEIGDRVAIVSHTIMGRLTFEGWADVVEAPVAGEWFYGVTFGDDKQVSYRMIHPGAQADPEAYVKRLNAQITRNP